MAISNAKIFRTGNPAGWAWTYDLVPPDASVDNFATAANPNAALDAIKPLISALPGTLSVIDVRVTTHEPQS